MTTVWSVLDQQEHTPADIEAALLAGADVNERRWWTGNATPLHHCARHNLCGDMEILLKYKADMQLKNDMGLTPLSLARVYHNDEAETLLQRQSSGGEAASVASGGGGGAEAVSSPPPASVATSPVSVSGRSAPPAPSSATPSAPPRPATTASDTSSGLNRLAGADSAPDIPIIVSVTTDSATLRWTAPSQIAGDVVRGFHVQVDQMPVERLSLRQNPYTVSELEPGSAHSFRVSAYSSKASSPWSKPVQFKLPSAAVDQTPAAGSRKWRLDKRRFFNLLVRKKAVDDARVVPTTSSPSAAPKTPTTAVTPHPPSSAAPGTQPRKLKPLAAATPSTSTPLADISTPNGVNTSANIPANKQSASDSPIGGGSRKLIFANPSLATVPNPPPSALPNGEASGMRSVPRRTLLAAAITGVVVSLAVVVMFAVYFGERNPSDVETITVISTNVTATTVIVREVSTGNVTVDNQLRSKKINVTEKLDTTRLDVLQPGTVFPSTSSSLSLSPEKATTSAKFVTPKSGSESTNSDNGNGKFGVSLVSANLLGEFDNTEGTIRSNRILSQRIVAMQDISSAGEIVSDTIIRAGEGVSSPGWIRTGFLNVSGDAEIGGDIDIGGNGRVAGDLDIEGDIRVAGEMDVSSGLISPILRRSGGDLEVESDGGDLSLSSLSGDISASAAANLRFSAGRSLMCNVSGNASVATSGRTVIESDSGVRVATESGGLDIEVGGESENSLAFERADVYVSLPMNVVDRSLSLSLSPPDEVTAVVDHSAYSHSVSVSSLTAVEDGVVDTCVRMNHSLASISLSLSPPTAVSMESGFSASLWLRWEGGEIEAISPTRRWNILSLSDVDGAEVSDVWLYMQKRSNETGTRVHAEVSGTGFTLSVSTPINVPLLNDGDWHHLSLSLSLSPSAPPSLSLAFDGIAPYASMTSSASSTATPQYLVWDSPVAMEVGSGGVYGVRSESADVWRGLVDGVNIRFSAFSAGEVAAYVTRERERGRAQEAGRVVGVRTRSGAEVAMDVQVENGGMETYVRRRFGVRADGGIALSGDGVSVSGDGRLSLSAADVYLAADERLSLSGGAGPLSLSAASAATLQVTAVDDNSVLRIALERESPSLSLLRSRVEIHSDGRTADSLSLSSSEGGISLSASDRVSLAGRTLALSPLTGLDISIPAGGLQSIISGLTSLTFMDDVSLSTTPGTVLTDWRRENCTGPFRFGRTAAECTLLPYNYSVDAVILVPEVGNVDYQYVYCCTEEMDSTRAAELASLTSPLSTPALSLSSASPGNESLSLSASHPSGGVAIRGGQGVSLSSSTRGVQILVGVNQGVDIQGGDEGVFVGVERGGNVTVDASGGGEIRMRATGVAVAAEESLSLSSVAGPTVISSPSSESLSLLHSGGGGNGTLEIVSESGDSLSALSLRATRGGLSLFSAGNMRETTSLSLDVDCGETYTLNARRGFSLAGDAASSISLTGGGDFTVDVAEASLILRGRGNASDAVYLQSPGGGVTVEASSSLSLSSLSGDVSISAATSLSLSTPGDLSLSGRGGGSYIRVSALGDGDEFSLSLSGRDVNSSLHIESEGDGEYSLFLHSSGRNGGLAVVGERENARAIWMVATAAGGDIDIESTQGRVTVEAENGIDIDGRERDVYIQSGGNVSSSLTPVGWRHTPADNSSDLSFSSSISRLRLQSSASLSGAVSLSASGSGDSSLSLSSHGDVADAISLSAVGTGGGISLSAQGGISLSARGEGGGDIDIAASGGANVSLSTSTGEGGSVEISGDAEVSISSAAGMSLSAAESLSLSAAGANLSLSGDSDITVLANLSLSLSGEREVDVYSPGEVSIRAEMNGEVNVASGNLSLSAGESLFLSAGGDIDISAVEAVAVGGTDVRVDAGDSLSLSAAAGDVSLSATVGDVSLSLPSGTSVSLSGADSSLSLLSSAGAPLSLSSGSDLSLSAPAGNLSLSASESLSLSLSTPNTPIDILSPLSLSSNLTLEQGWFIHPEGVAMGCPGGGQGCLWEYSEGVKVHSGNAVSEWVHTASGVGESLSLSLRGAVAASLALSSEGTGVDAVAVTAANGGISLSAAAAVDISGDSVAMSGSDSVDINGVNRMTLTSASVLMGTNTAYPPTSTASLHLFSAGEDSTTLHTEFSNAANVSLLTLRDDGRVSLPFSLSIGTAMDVDGVAGRVSFNGAVTGRDAIVFEGTVDDGTATTLRISNPTSPNVITVPDRTLTVNQAEDLAGTVLATSITTSSLEVLGTLRNLSVRGDVELIGDQIIIGNTSSLLSIDGRFIGASYIFEGDNIDDVSTTLTFAEPALDVTVTIPNRQMTVNEAESLFGTTLPASITASSISSLSTLTSLDVSGATVLESNLTVGTDMADYLWVNAVVQGDVPLRFSGDADGLAELYVETDATGYVNQVVLPARNFTVNQVEDLTGTTLPATITASSLTSVSTLTSLSVSGSTTLGSDISLDTLTLSSSRIVNEFPMFFDGTVAADDVTSAFRFISTDSDTSNIFTFVGTRNVTVGAASDLFGTVLSAEIVNSSLETLGDLQELTVAGNTDLAGDVIVGRDLEDGIEIRSSLVGTSLTFEGPLIGDGEAVVLDIEPSGGAVTYVTVPGDRNLTVNQVEDLTGTALPASVVSSALTSVGTLSSLSVDGTVSISGGSIALGADRAADTLTVDAAILGDLPLRFEGATPADDAWTELEFTVSGGDSVNVITFVGSVNMTVNQAEDLMGAALPSTIVSSSLETVGTLDDLTVGGPVVLGSGKTDAVTIPGTIIGEMPLTFQPENDTGAGAPRTRFHFETPTVDRVITFPDRDVSVNNATTLVGHTLSSDVQYSSLIEVGTLWSLNVDGDVRLGADSIDRLQINSTITGDLLFEGQSGGTSSTRLQFEIGVGAPANTIIVPASNIRLNDASDLIGSSLASTVTSSSLTTLGTLTALQVAGPATIGADDADGLKFSGRVVGRTPLRFTGRTGTTRSGSVAFEIPDPLLQNYTVTFPSGDYEVNNALDLQGSELAPGITTSSLTELGVLSEVHVDGRSRLLGRVTLGNDSADAIVIKGRIASRTWLMKEDGAGQPTTTIVFNEGVLDNTVTFPSTDVTVNHAPDLTGSSLPPNVVTSHLEELGDLTNLTVLGDVVLGTHATTLQTDLIRIKGRIVGTMNFMGNESNPLGNFLTKFKFDDPNTAGHIGNQHVTFHFPALKKDYYIQDAGTLDGATLASNVVSSSLTTVGELTDLTMAAQADINILEGSLVMDLNNRTTASYRPVEFANVETNILREDNTTAPTHSLVVRINGEDYYVLLQKV